MLVFSTNNITKTAGEVKFKSSDKHLFSVTTHRNWVSSYIAHKWCITANSVSQTSFCFNLFLYFWAQNTEAKGHDEVRVGDGRNMFEKKTVCCSLDTHIQNSSGWLHIQHTVLNVLALGSFHLCCSQGKEIKINMNKLKWQSVKRSLTFTAYKYKCIIFPRSKSLLNCLKTLLGVLLLWSLGHVPGQVTQRL